MYTPRYENGILTSQFVRGLESFIEYATSQPLYMDGDKIKCPCKRCDNKPYKEIDEVRFHISKYGFVRDYHIWRYHGEATSRCVDMMDYQPSSTYHSMVMDHAGPHFNEDDIEEPPNPEAQRLYDMLNAADKQLWPGCKNHSQLSLVVRLMSLKAENHMSERYYDQLTELMKEILPQDNLVPDNFYSTKKLLRGMGLPVEKIDCCPNNCMIYWRADSELVSCKFCNTSRFKDTSRESGRCKNKNVAAMKTYYFPLT